MMPSQPTFLCPKCNGEKVVFTGNYKTDEKTGEYKGVTQSCEVCQGSGSILETLRELYIRNI